MRQFILPLVYTFTRVLCNIKVYPSEASVLWVNLCNRICKYLNECSKMPITFEMFGSKSSEIYIN